jgi:hypothetical protein
MLPASAGLQLVELCLPKAALADELSDYMLFIFRATRSARD